MNTRLIILGITFFSLVFLGACKKYEDGPKFSLRSKKIRAEGNWKIDKRIVNNSEQALSDDDRDDRLDIKKNNEFTFTNPGNSTINGNWDFDGEKENLVFAYTVEILDGSGNVVSTEVREYHEILRLKNKELWLKQIVDGDVIETHYIPS